MKTALFIIDCQGDRIQEESPLYSRLLQKIDSVDVTDFVINDHTFHKVQEENISVNEAVELGDDANLCKCFSERNENVFIKHSKNGLKNNSEFRKRLDCLYSQGVKVFIFVGFYTNICVLHAAETTNEYFSQKGIDDIQCVIDPELSKTRYDTCLAANWCKRILLKAER